jgi:hypothetical protein
MESSGAATILRWGLAFVFFYAAIASLLDPTAWAGYVPQFLDGFISPSLFLAGFSIYELILAGMLFWGKKLWWSSLFATITLAGIVIFDFQVIDVVFRDVGLAFAALALFQTARDNNSH